MKEKYFQLSFLNILLLSERDLLTLQIMSNFHSTQPRGEYSATVDHHTADSSYKIALKVTWTISRIDILANSLIP